MVFGVDAEGRNVGVIFFRTGAGIVCRGAAIDGVYIAAGLTASARTDRAGDGVHGPVGNPCTGRMAGSGGCGVRLRPLASQGLLRALTGAQKAAEIIACDSIRNPRSLREYCEFYSDHAKRFARERHFFFGL